jgi:hypothetical protein
MRLAPMIQDHDPMTEPRKPTTVAGKTGPAGQPSTRARVPFMVTAAMKRQLRDAGYTDTQIREMRPAEAHQIIAAGREKPSPTIPTPPKRLSLADLKAAAVSRRTQLKT